MANKFLELTSSPLMNLDHTYRYSGTKLVEAESLSQHIVDTIMMGLKIISNINAISGETHISPSEYVMKAVYHDLEEVITGDVPRPLKYYNETTRDSLKNVADEVAKKLFKEQFADDYLGHYHYWESAKEGDAGVILKIVDTLVVANKVIREVVLLNNCYMLRVAHEVSQYLRELVSNIHADNKQVQDYLVELVSGALDAMEEILFGNKKTMDSLNIRGQSMI